MAKLDHMVYKNNAYSSMLEGKLNFTIQDHTACRLGQWYNQDGKKDFESNSEFKAILEPHKRVHEDIQKVISKLGSKDVNAILVLFDDAEKASKELFEHLDNMTK